MRPKLFDNSFFQNVIANLNRLADFAQKVRKGWEDTERAQTLGCFSD